MARMNLSAHMRLPFVLTALALLPFSSGAFSWQPQPTAELKASCIRFARRGGLDAFADRIERQDDLTTWIDDSIRTAESLLATCEGAPARNRRRATALGLLDYPFHVDNYAKETPKAEREAFASAVFAYARRARERVLREVRTARVPEGRLRLWHVYSMTYVIKGCRHTALIDFTPCPTINRRTQWTDEEWRGFAELGDLLVVTHPHGDHTSYPLMKLMRERDKALVLPCAMRDPATSNVYSAATGAHVLDCDHAEPVEIAGVKFWNFLGDQGKNMPCNTYLMEIDGVRVADNGDNTPVEKYEGLKACPPADIIIASTWNRVTDFVGSCMSAPGFSTEKAVFLPSHENELSHYVNHRESYREMYTDKRRLAAPGFTWPRTLPLAWGESVLAP